MNRSHFRHLFAAVTVAGSAVGVWAQPADAPPPPPPAGADGARPDSPEALRAMLSRRMERTDREQAALTEALQMLDRGDSADEVRGFLRGKMGDEWRERAEQWRDRRERPGDGRRPAAPPRGGEGPEDDMFGRGPRDRGGPDGAEGGPKRPAEGPPLAPERALELLQDVNPPMFERLRRLRERNPEEFREAMRRIGPRLAEFDGESRAHPGMWRLRVQMFRLEREARDLARTITKGGDEQQTKDAAARLTAVVGEQFDLRVRMREQEVTDLTERVTEIQGQIEKAAGERETLVAKRVRELVHEAREGDGPPPRRMGDGPPGHRSPPRREAPAQE